MHIEPYLHFNGNCEEALAFYGQAIGAKIEMLMRYRDSPESPPPGMVPPGMDDKVMHASFRIGESVVMASDDCTGQAVSFLGFQLSLGVADATEAERCFSALAEGGRITMPLGTTFFASSFGMLVDRFGVAWMVIAVDQQSQGGKP